MKDLADDTLLVGGSHPLFADTVGADPGGHGVAEAVFFERIDHRAL